MNPVAMRNRCRAFDGGGEGTQQGGCRDNRGSGGQPVMAPRRMQLAQDACTPSEKRDGDALAAYVARSF